MTREAGRHLAALHAVSPPGRGPIAPSGVTDTSLGPMRRAGGEAMRKRSEELLAKGVSRSLVERTEALILDGEDVLEAAPDSLVHGDWTVANLLGVAGSISGVIDWGGAGGGDPAGDFVGWEFWSDHGPTSLEKLLAGYVEGGGNTDGAFERRRLLHRVNNLHDAMSHFLFTNRGDLLDEATTALDAALAAAGA